MQLQIHYDFSAKLPLYDPDYPNKARALHAAGVEVIWLTGYFYGTYASTPDEIAKAKKILEDDGFQVGVINLPFGHGGNALDPNDSAVNLAIGSGWRMRMTADGKYMCNTTCISEKMLADSKAVAEEIRDIGIHTIFYDDDLRLGMWGPALQGCYCEHCMERFQAAYNVRATREEIASERDAALSEAWKTFQCGNLLHFLHEVTVDGITSGVMVMHNGDRRHGIDIARIRRELPSTLIRVGEGHFCDDAYTHELAQDALLNSIHTHMALAGDSSICYSESTVFPANALSPDNWIDKIRLEIRAGLRNIYLMSGTWYLTPEYWSALAKALPELRELAETTPEPTHQVMPFVWQI